MSLPVNRPYDEIVVSGRMADVATAEVAYFVSPVKGYIRRMYTVVLGTTNGTAILTLTANGAAVTAPTLTIASAGGAGDVDSVEFGRNAAVFVQEGAAFSVASDGGGSTTVITNIFVVIEPA